MSEAVADAWNQNGWTAASYSVQTVSAGLQVPAGTQFWVYSSTGSLTLAGDPAIFLTDAASVDQVIVAATQPVTLDLSLFLPPDTDASTDGTQTSATIDSTATSTDPTSSTASGTATDSSTNTTSADSTTSTNPGT